MNTAFNIRDYYHPGYWDSYPPDWIYLDGLTLPFLYEGYRRVGRYGHKQGGFILFQHGGQVYRMEVRGTSCDTNDPHRHLLAVLEGSEFPIAGDLL